MPIELDRSGVPHYHGDPELADEYSERCWDFFYVLKTADNEAASVRLRSGLTGKAYVAVRSLSHEQLVVGKAGTL